MSQGLVSIIIPCFNAERCVAQAIESALGQTYPNVEVIVIDDGSTDGSIDVIRTFGDRVRWETGPNRGGCAARNRGFELAQGQLIQFLDADDLLYPGKLEAQVPIAIQKRPAIVYCDYDRVLAGDKTPSEVHSRDCAGLDPLVFALKTVLLQTSAPLHWKESLVAAGGFRTDLRASQEFDLHVRLAAQGHQFFHLPQSLYMVRRQPGSLSDNFVRTACEQLKFLPQLAAELREQGKLTEPRARAFAERLAWNGRACTKLGDFEAASKFFKAAKQIHPKGGLDGVYSVGTRVLRRIVGTRLTEALVVIKRGLSNHGRGRASKHVEPAR